MVWVNEGGGVDLQHVVGVSGVLEQAIHWIEHLVREKEEPFSGRAAIVQPLLPSEDYVQTATQVLRLEPHYLGMGE